MEENRKQEDAKKTLTAPSRHLHLLVRRGGSVLRVVSDYPQLFLLSFLASLPLWCKLSSVTTSIQIQIQIPNLLREKFENRFVLSFWNIFEWVWDLVTLCAGYLWVTRWWASHVCWPAPAHSCHHPSPGLQQRFPQIMSLDIWAECKCNYPRWTFLVTPTLAGLGRGVKQLNLGPNLRQIFVWHRSEWGQCV